MPDEERQHTVCRYTGNCQPGVFQGEIPKGDTGVFPEGGGFPHWPGRTGKYRVVGGTHGRENAPPAFDLCSADKGQPPVCKGDYRQPGKPDEVAGRFSRLYGREISRLGAWGELKNYYSDWELVKYNENLGHLHRLDEYGNPIALQFATMLAKKVK